MAGKKKFEKLPPTKAETVEERLDELVEHKSIYKYVTFEQGTEVWSMYINGECRNYPDGFETLDRDHTDRGMLHHHKKKIIVWYDIDVEMEHKEKE